MVRGVFSENGVRMLSGLNKTTSVVPLRWNLASGQPQLILAMNVLRAARGIGRQILFLARGILIDTHTHFSESYASFSQPENFANNKIKSSSTFKIT